MTSPCGLDCFNCPAHLAMEDDEHLLDGLNVHAGQLTCFPVGEAQGLDVISPRLALRA